MAKVNHITHKKSDVANKAPKAGDLANGEIAVNYADGTERMYIKNASGKIIPFSSDHIIIGGIIDTVLASKTSAKGYDVSSPILANVYGSKESLNSVLSHYKMGLFKDGALVKECAPCRITKAVDGSDINIDGSEGDIMIYTDVPIYRDRCRVSGVTVPNSTATTHNVIGLGLMPHQVGGKEAKKMNPFAFTPGYVQLHDGRYYSCYNPSYSGSGVGNDDYNGTILPNKDVLPIFTTNFIGDKGAQGGYPVMWNSAIDSMKRSRAKGDKYQGIFYEFYEMWLIAMYLELGTLNFTRQDYFGRGCYFDGNSDGPSPSYWISGGTGGIFLKDEKGDGVDRYARLDGGYYTITVDGSEKFGSPLNGLLGFNTDNFEEALESQRFVDALVRSNLTDKVDGATVLEYNDNGDVIVSNGVDVASGSGMTEGKKYYVIRDVPNCQGIRDGVMTYVLNVFVKTTFNKDVYTYDTNVGGKNIIFKFSYPTYRGLELLSGAYTPIEGFNYIVGDQSTSKLSVWYAKDFTDIKYNPTNFEASYDSATRRYADVDVKQETPDEDIPFINGFVKGGEYTNDLYGWVKNADYDVSLYCTTECSYLFANESTYECCQGGGKRTANDGRKIVNSLAVTGRILFPDNMNLVSISLAGGFSIGNPTL